MHRLARQCQCTRSVHDNAYFLRRNLHNGRTLVQELNARQFIANVTRPDELEKHLKKPQTIYSGIDPTAKSLHAGHLIPLLCLLHFQLRGNNVIALIGGATGLVGDPSGRTAERELSEKTQIELNTLKLIEAIQRFFSRAATYAKNKLSTQESTLLEVQVLNNLTWLKDINLLDFLRTTGIHFRVNNMLARDSVKMRMSTQQGISFTEFTYQLLQGYDFYELYKTRGCTIQLGGSDQWGNILSGIELISKVELGAMSGESTMKEKGFALTTPLLTSSTGEKFGKSAGNAVWLDENLTSYLDFYQFFMRTADADVEKYLKMFTLLPVEEISSVIQDHQTHPEYRIAQKLLATEATLMVHGEEGLNAARIATEVLFSTKYPTLKADQIIQSLAGDPRLVFCSEEEIFGTSLPNLVANHKLAPSRSAARQLVQAGGLYLNNVAQRDPRFLLTRDVLVDGRVAIVRAGKDQHLVLALR
ncbi:tyrosyl-tRNA synthetase [Gyrodon lividus]|nr:tyrosyl-tRNA synthetase [Gyrodon lividus]